MANRAAIEKAFRDVQGLGAIELPVTSAELTAGARHLGQYCREANAAFTACKVANHGDPKLCIAQGAAVTTCTKTFFDEMKKHCGAEYEAQWQCLNKSNLQYEKCRTTQTALDGCVLDKMVQN